MSHGTDNTSESWIHWPQWNSGMTALVLFVASLVVILEGAFHAFVVLDEFALTILRNTGMFAQRSAQDGAARPIGELCQAGVPRHAVVLVPSVFELGKADSCEACPLPAGGSPETDLPFQVVEAIYRLRPKVLALDLDLSQAATATARAALLAVPNGDRKPDSATRLALVVLPLSGSTDADGARRQRRHAFARKVCENPRAAVASAHVARSPRFGDVVQFYWDRLPEPDDGALPPVFPSLGQVARLLDDGLDAKNGDKGPGFVCNLLASEPVPERIPFVDQPRTDIEKAQEPFEAAAYPSTRYSLKWINPAAVRQDIAVFSARNARDLETLRTLSPACLAKKVVFVGTEISEYAHDSFATVAGDATPGVLVHAMSAVSAGREIISKLSLSAIVDLVIGFSVVALVRLLRLGFARALLRTFRFFNKDFGEKQLSQSLALRGLLTGVEVLVPSAVAACAVLLCLVSFEHGWFFNPLIAFFGMWLHGVLERFFEWPEASKAPGPAWRRWLPQSERSAWPPLKGLDTLVYGGFACLYIATLAWAFGILLSRVKLVLS